MVHKLILVAIAAATTLLAAGSAGAQPIHQRVVDALVPDRPSHPAFTDPVSRDSPNAAGRYLALFADLEPDLALAAGWAWGDVTLTYGDAPDIANAPMPLEELRRRLEEAQPWIEQVIETSRMEQFNRRLSEDLFVRLLNEDDPRHGFHRSARATVRILRADASRLWEAGHPEEAVERIATIIRLGGQLADDAVDLVDVLMTQAIVGLGVDRALKSLTADPDVATDSLIEAVGDLHARDPARGLEIWNRTRHAVAQLAEQELQGEQIGDRLLALLLQTEMANMVAGEFIEVFEQALDGKLPQFDGEPVSDPDTAELLEDVRRAVQASDVMAPDELRKLLEEGRRLGDQLVEAWYTESGAERAEALDRRIDEDETLLLDTMLPIPRGIQRSSFRLRGEVDKLREALTPPEPEQR